MGTAIWREVDDALFWHHSFEVAAPKAYADYCSAALPPRAAWPAPEDAEAIKTLIEDRATLTVAEGGAARPLAEDVYRRFLEVSVTPIQGSIRTALIDHG